MSHKIAIIIPFFQKREGILSAAIRSAFKQHGVNKLDIIVIDDQSPVPADSELVSLRREGLPTEYVRIIRQQNTGPAGARNKGLDSVVPGTEYIAFLDSDDQWEEGHLSNAITALDLGYDFYFADFYHLGADTSAFNRAKRITPADHRTLDKGDLLHEYHGDMFNQILFGNVIGTSTVVYRFSTDPLLRFREDLINAGEDYIFWLMLAKTTCKIAFSARCECYYGEGVNVYSGSGWGTDNFIDRVHYEIKYRKLVEKMFNLTQAQIQKNRQLLRNLRSAFMKGLIHSLLHRKPLKLGLLMGHACLDPLSFLCLGAMLEKSRRQ